MEILAGSGYSSACLNGNTCWISDDVLQCLDFTRERFRGLCLPNSLHPFREEEVSEFFFFFFGFKSQSYVVHTFIIQERWRCG